MRTGLLKNYRETGRLMDMKNYKLGVLLILDGFGINVNREYNCVALAQTPTYDYLSNNATRNKLSWYKKNIGKTYYTQLEAVGPEIGMPKGAKGSTAVGHEVISGADYLHPMLRIEKQIKKGVLRNNVIDNALNNVLKYNSALHLMGLVSPNREHSDIKHLYAILRRCSELGVKKIWIHFFSDGRGTPPFSAVSFAEDLMEAADKILGKNFEGFKIATVGGRDITMNRAKDCLYKTEKTFRAIAEADAPREKDIFTVLKNSYSRAITDEYTELRVLGNYQGFGNNDSVIYWNFRKDRAEYLMRMLTSSEEEITQLLKSSPDYTYHNLKEFKKIKKNGSLDYISLCFAAFMEYYKGIACPVAFPEPQQLISLGSVLEDFGFKQYRISGVDKEKAVMLLSGSKHSEPFSNEIRYVVHLPEDMKKYREDFGKNAGEYKIRLNPYARFPLLELPELKQRILSLIDSAEDKTFIVANICNPDMVGHTADLGAGIIAVEEVDRALLEIGLKVIEKGGFAAIVADHGNIEKMMTDEWEPSTFHTDAEVPFILLGVHDLEFKDIRGSLKDVAPTILYLLKPDKKEYIKDNFKGKILAELKKG
ncbi:MAG: hypothetical protein FJW68_06520 [Actinobacteria bacterium]|nr:hypothetical protein [Actinomycetota bacterium]